MNNYAFWSVVLVLPALTETLAANTPVPFPPCWPLNSPSESRNTALGFSSSASLRACRGSVPPPALTLASHLLSRALLSGVAGTICGTTELSSNIRRVWWENRIT